MAILSFIDFNVLFQVTIGESKALGRTKIFDGGESDGWTFGHLLTDGGSTTPT